MFRAKSLTCPGPAPVLIFLSFHCDIVTRMVFFVFLSLPPVQCAALPLVTWLPSFLPRVTTPKNFVSFLGMMFGFLVNPAGLRFAVLMNLFRFTCKARCSLWTMASRLHIKGATTITKKGGADSCRWAIWGTQNTAFTFYWSGFLRVVVCLQHAAK